MLKPAVMEDSASHTEKLQAFVFTEGILEFYNLIIIQNLFHWNFTLHFF